MGAVQWLWPGAEQGLGAERGGHGNMGHGWRWNQGHAELHSTTRRDPGSALDSFCHPDTDPQAEVEDVSSVLYTDTLTHTHIHIHTDAHITQIHIHTYAHIHIQTHIHTYTYKERAVICRNTLTKRDHSTACKHKHTEPEIYNQGRGHGTQDRQMTRMKQERHVQKLTYRHTQ